MRITIDRDGRKEAVEVAPGTESVTIEGRTYPVKVVRESDLKVELEIAGERVVVDAWPAHFPDPPGPVDVNGERWTVAVERGAGAAVRRPASERPMAAAPTVAPAATVVPEGTLAVVPPMPGRILEVRVQEGSRVGKGEVLLVLEAMKMRNEVASPGDGVVRRLSVKVGSNVRAREPMLYVETA